MAQPRGLPRNVCVWSASPRDAPQASMAARVPRHTEIGKPPAMALPRQMRSGGGAPSASKANQAPVRPKPE